MCTMSDQAELCVRCSETFAEFLRNILSSDEAIQALADNTPYQVLEYHQLPPFYNAREQCWLCMRIWCWLRVVAGPRHRLSTKEEVFSHVFDISNPGQIKFLWSCKPDWDCGRFAQISLDIQDSGLGLLLRVQDDDPSGESKISHQLSDGGVAKIKPMLEIYSPEQTISTYNATTSSSPQSDRRKKRKHRLDSVPKHVPPNIKTAVLESEHSLIQADKVRAPTSPKRSTLAENVQVNSQASYKSDRNNVVKSELQNIALAMSQPVDDNNFLFDSSCNSVYGWDETSWKHPDWPVSELREQELFEYDATQELSLSSSTTKKPASTLPNIGSELLPLFDDSNKSVKEWWQEQDIWKPIELDPLKLEEEGLTWSPVSSPRLELARPRSKRKDLSKIERGTPNTKNARAQNAEHALDSSRIEQIKTWLDTCNRNRKCSTFDARRGVLSFIPTRLVKIGQATGSLSLTIPSGDPAYRLSPYATLSHCWGSGVSLILTEQNHDALLQDIDVNALSKTFQEAIILCRSIGIWYIWIDSLCIIQNSAESADWIAESSKMHLIYGNSELNIAASASVDGSEGLFRDRVFPFEDNLLISAVVQGKQLIVREEYNVSSRLLDEFWKNAPLHTRGWVTQELFLSTRNLHFTDTQLYWQCNCGLQSEWQCSSLGYWRGKSKPSPPPNINDIYWHSLKPWARSVVEIDRLWCKVVADYSGSHLTFDSDRLVALSGLAAHFQERYASLGIKTRYFAGCWEHSLAFWLTHRPVCCNEVSANLSSVPSWSWLALGRPVTYQLFGNGITSPTTRTAMVIQQTRIDVELENLSAPFGSIKHAQILGQAKFFYVEVPQSFLMQSLEPAAEARVISESGNSVLLTQGIKVWIDKWSSDELRRSKVVRRFQAIYLADIHDKQSSPDIVVHYALLVEATSTKYDDTVTYKRRGLLQWLAATSSDIRTSHAAEMITGSTNNFRKFVLV